MAIRFSEIIDRIWITVPLKVAQLMQCSDQQWTDIKAKKAKPKQIKGGWRSTYDFGGDVSVGVTVAKLYGYRYLQYDLKPMELNAAAFEQFIQIASAFPGGDYATALVDGRVSYLEIAIDFLLKDTADVLIHKAGAQKSKRFFPPSGAPPTSYAGAVKSVSKSVAYTKASPKVLNGYILNSPRARIERRLRNLGLPPVKLLGLSNKFANVEVYSIAAAESLANHQIKNWKPFLQKAKMVGVASALADFPVHRKQLLASLGKCRVPWWKPATYMTNWEQTVAQQLRLSLASG